MLPLGLLTEIMPPHIHIHLALLISAGCPITIVFPGGAQGAVMAGVQGMGVSTPMAADVAEATVGLLID